MRLFAATALVTLLALSGPTALAQSFAEGWSAYLRVDYATAVENFEPVAEQGGDEAQLMLGVMYTHGQGVSENPVLAFMLENLAAAQGNENARKNRDLSLEFLTSEQITEGQRLASEWRVGTPLPTSSDVTTWP